MDYTLSVSQQDLQLIFRGLGELQAKDVVNLMNKIGQQTYAQDLASAVPLSDLGLSEAPAEAPAEGSAP